MRKFLLSAFFLSAAINNASAQSPWIVGGGLATEQQFPWVTNIIYESNHYCGAALIHPNWVLTAGHCLVDFNTYGPIDTARAILRFNTIRSSGPVNSSGGAERRIKRIFPHPNFDIQQFLVGYDIGLIELKDPVNSITPIPLPAMSDTAVMYNTGRPVKIAGWGLIDTTTFPAASDILKWCATNVYDLTLCNQLAMANLGAPVSHDRFCAGYKAGEAQAGAAAGDSGGPIWWDSTASKVLIGVVSGGFGQTTLTDKPGLFTKVAMYRAWIDSVMNSVATDVPDVAWNDENISVGASEHSINLYFKNLGTNKINIALYNLDGKRVYNTEVLQPSYRSYEINSDDMMPGMYILRIYNYDKGSQYTKKMIKTAR